MESRTDKYSNDSLPTRSQRNARLYREVYGKYDNLENLPLEDNTDEIDMNRLQEILRGSEAKKQRIMEENKLNVVEQRKRNIDEQRVYDINKILEKAKYENHKLKSTTPSPKINTSILSTLQDREVSMSEVEELKQNYEAKKELKKELDKEEALSMTRELKFKELSEEVSENPLIDNVMPNNDLSLDLFENLKPSENTITTKPIRETDTDTDFIPKKVEIIKNAKDIDVHSRDTSDIDIIKTKDNLENDFFTSSYEFSDSDFLDGPTRKGNIFKIILLILAIIVFAGAIAYFVIRYGIGA